MKWTGAAEDVSMYRRRHRYRLALCFAMVDSEIKKKKKIQKKRAVRYIEKQIIKNNDAVSWIYMSLIPSSTTITTTNTSILLNLSSPPTSSRFPFSAIAPSFLLASFSSSSSSSFPSFPPSLLFSSVNFPFPLFSFFFFSLFCLLSFFCAFAPTVILTLYFSRIVLSSLPPALYLDFNPAGQVISFLVTLLHQSLADIRTTTDSVGKKFTCVWANVAFITSIFGLSLFFLPLPQSYIASEKRNRKEDVGYHIPPLPRTESSSSCQPYYFRLRPPLSHRGLRPTSS